VLLVLLWGVNFAAIKSALAEINVLAFGALRFGLAALVLSAVVWARGEGLGFARREWPAVAALGLVGHTAYQLLFTFGLDRTSTGHSALMMALVPVIVAVIGTARGLERLSAQRWMGVGLSFAGIALVVLGGEGGGRASVLGDGLVLAGAVAWSLYTVFGGPLMARHSPVKLTAVTMIVGAAGLAALAAAGLAGQPGLLDQDWAAVTPRGWGLYLYSTLGGLVVAYVIWYTGVQRLGGARTAVYSNLVPVVALVMGWFAFGERLGPIQAAGALVALAGVWLARRHRAPTSPPGTPSRGRLGEGGGASG
jgi:drug/metabolite transporter (DMT)-like permease